MELYELWQIGCEEMNEEDYGSSSEEEFEEFN